MAKTPDFLARAMRYIEQERQICIDVAANYGQQFDNVKHMRWFALAVADALEHGI